MSEFPKELREAQEIDDILDDPDSGATAPFGIPESILDADTGESVARFIDAEFSSAVETEEKEAAIKRLLSSVPETLRKFGIEGASSIDEALLDELMGYGYEDEDDIENLYFYVWDKFREEFGTYARITPAYMIDFADRKNSDELEREQSNDAIHSLIDIGVNADHAP